MSIAATSVQTLESISLAPRLHPSFLLHTLCTLCNKKLGRNPGNEEPGNEAYHYTCAACKALGDASTYWKANVLPCLTLACWKRTSLAGGLLMSRNWYFVFIDLNCWSRFVDAERHN